MLSQKRCKERRCKELRTSFSPADFRKARGLFPTGVAIVSGRTPDVRGVEFVPLSQFAGVPPIVEDEPTFEGNAKKKAQELARFLALAQRVGFANQSTAGDDDDETDNFESLSAQRSKETSGRHRPVTLGSSGRLPVVPQSRSLDIVVMADDSGLEVDALKGAPGVLSARYAGTHGDDAANNSLLLKNLKGVPPEKRKARFV